MSTRKLTKRLSATSDVVCLASVSVWFESNQRGRRIHFLALVSFFALSKPKMPFLGLSLHRNQTETLTTQATSDAEFAVLPLVNSVCCRHYCHVVFAKSLP